MQVQNVSIFISIQLYKLPHDTKSNSMGNNKLSQTYTIPSHIYNHTSILAFVQPYSILNKPSTTQSANLDSVSPITFRQTFSGTLEVRLKQTLRPLIRRHQQTCNGLVDSPKASIKTIICRYKNHPLLQEPSIITKEIQLDLIACTRQDKKANQQIDVRKRWLRGVVRHQYRIVSVNLTFDCCNSTNVHDDHLLASFLLVLLGALPIHPQILI
eukprot:TRINITY_DN4936_c0_g1_i1.p1 TRINITY_DN4936_c0_g1~~TRINITY_DN4936_c0_g1_i1.p1  ORF type:complete len:213 (+),score=-10.79 TRINITY_DN4936_c0_g1_i1:294-932(+)